jgi:V-type H+-transporting ATPase subunit d
VLADAFDRYSYMIDNVILFIQGKLHGRDLTEIESKCHPLGKFPEMGGDAPGLKSLAACDSIHEVHDLVLADTPLAPYFSVSLKREDLDELNIEIIRNILYKAYLEDFNEFCQALGGETAEVMGEILAVRTVVLISVSHPQRPRVIDPERTA